MLFQLLVLYKQWCWRLVVGCALWCLVKFVVCERRSSLSSSCARTQVLVEKLSSKKNFVWSTAVCTKQVDFYGIRFWDKRVRGFLDILFRVKLFNGY